MTTFLPWRIGGSYYEVCNCEAICPCRRQRGEKGGRPSYQTCDFALSWWITEGHAGAVELTGLRVVMAGRWETTPGDPWHIILYLDDRATAAQQAALEALFLGRAGGAIGKGFAARIAGVQGVKRAAIDLDHGPGRERIEVAPYLTVRTREDVPHGFTITCGIPGHEYPGQESRAELFRYRDAPFDWEFRGKCGFATNFSYSS